MNSRLVAVASLVIAATSAAWANDAEFSALKPAVMAYMKCGTDYAGFLGIISQESPSDIAVTTATECGNLRQPIIAGLYEGWSAQAQSLTETLDAAFEKDAISAVVRSRAGLAR